MDYYWLSIISFIILRFCYSTSCCYVGEDLNLQDKNDNLYKFGALLKWMQPFSLYFKSLYSLSSHACKNVNLLASPRRIMIFVVVSFSSLFSCDLRWLNLAIQTLVLNQVSKFPSLKMSRSRPIYSHYWARENMMSATCANCITHCYTTRKFINIMKNSLLTPTKCASRGEIFRNCQRREKHKTWMRSTHTEKPGATTKCGEISL